MKLRMVLIALLLIVAVAAAVLWTPDKSRAELEARYSEGPAGFIEVSGLRLHVRQSGPADAPVLLLLHGFGSSLHTWDDWARALPEYRVIRLDLPGFGLTGPDPTGDYSDKRSVQVLASLLDTLNVGRATVVGHSLGGRVAWQFAASHPERTAKLVLVSPDGFASPGFEYGKAPAVPAVLNLMRYVLPKFMLKMNLEPGYANPAAMTDALLQRYYDLMLAPGVRGAILDRLGQTVLQDPVPTLSRIAAPVLLLWGEQDAMIPFTNSADYQRVLPDSAVVSLPGVGHLVQEEAPDRSVQALRAFLEKPVSAAN
jgi:pimeloyl-ACP methyl ester carboxylesterase